MAPVEVWPGKVIGPARSEGVWLQRRFGPRLKKNLYIKIREEDFGKNVIFL